MSSPRTGILSLIRFDLGQNWDQGGARGYGVIARVYDSSYRVEPVDMMSEPESMTAVIGWSQWK